MTNIETPETPQTHSGFVALIGAPNAGKSTLINQLVGAKVSIVTHKVQTTRAIVRGIATHENAQIVFVDTPGIFKPKRRLDTAMVTTAWGGAKDADVVVLLIDVERGITTHHEPEAQLNRKMVETARQVIAITDSSKFGKVCLHRIIDISEIDALITDADAPDFIRDASEKLGFKLHQA